MGTGVAMFDFGKEHWGRRHVKVNDQRVRRPVWHGNGWRAADIRGRCASDEDDWRYARGGILTENSCRRLGGTVDPLSNGHFGLCVECRRRMVDDVYRGSIHHWDSDIERQKFKEAGGVIEGGLRQFVMEQYADDHWLNIRDKWGLDVDGEWKAGADESFPCHGGKHWTRTEANIFM